MGGGPAVGLTAPREGGVCVCVCCGGAGGCTGLRREAKLSGGSAAPICAAAGGERAPRAAGRDEDGGFTCSLDPRGSETLNRTSRSREPEPTGRDERPLLLLLLQGMMGKNPHCSHSPSLSRPPPPQTLCCVQGPTVNSLKSSSVVKRRLLCRPLQALGCWRVQFDNPVRICTSFRK